MRNFQKYIEIKDIIKEIDIFEKDKNISKKRLNYEISKAIEKIDLIVGHGKKDASLYLCSENEFKKIFPTIHYKDFSFEAGYNTFVKVGIDYYEIFSESKDVSVEKSQCKKALMLNKYVKKVKRLKV